MLLNFIYTSYNFSLDKVIISQLTYISVSFVIQLNLRLIYEVQICLSAVSGLCEIKYYYPEQLKLD